MHSYLSAKRATTWRRLSLVPSLLLLLISSACSLTPDVKDVKQLGIAKQKSSNGTIIWDGIFYYVQGNDPNHPDQPWHQAPSWMYGQGGAIPNPKATDLPGTYSPPEQVNVVWKSAYISAPLPGEEGDANPPHLVSYFSYGTANSLYIHSMGAYLSGQLSTANTGYPSSYRSFNVVSVEPAGGAYPTFSYLITYDVEVLGSGPGGPQLDVEPRRTVLATYDFSTGTGTYQ